MFRGVRPQLITHACTPPVFLEDFSLLPNLYSRLVVSINLLPRNTSCMLGVITLHSLARNY